MKYSLSPDDEPVSVSLHVSSHHENQERSNRHPIVCSTTGRGGVSTYPIVQRL
jgi:hypothetical protein